MKKTNSILSAGLIITFSTSSVFAETTVFDFESESKAYLEGVTKVRRESESHKSALLSEIRDTGSRRKRSNRARKSMTNIKLPPKPKKRRRKKAKNVSPKPDATVTERILKKLKDKGKSGLNRTLFRGQRSFAIEQMQKILARLGFKLKIDGIFGPQTYRTLRVFQQNTGIPRTGVFNAATRHAVQQILESKLRIAQNTHNVRKNLTIYSYQKKLVKKGYMTKQEVATGPGRHGFRTERAVRGFQSRNGLAVDGIVGPKTFKKLFLSASKGKAKSKRKPKPVNSRNSYSKRIQKKYKWITGRGMRITSEGRTPRQQARAMRNNLRRYGSRYIYSQYIDDRAVKEILDANKLGGINAMTRTIKKQIANGKYISVHLRNGAMDVALSANERVLRKVVAEVGGTVIRERDHFHVRFRLR